jgi:predicted alpha/beta superfamily hydrolase
MKHHSKLIILAMVLLCFGCKKEVAKTQTTTKETSNKTSQAFSIGEVISYPSKILNEDRVLNIYLPNSYQNDTTKTYPVIYLLDGSKDEDFIHISGLVQFGSFSWINMLPESIVVGISNIDRKRDFTYPSNNKLDNEELPTSGGSEKFINFIEQELQPYISNNYRVTETKTIIGQSLGGLLATEILFKKPQLFNNYVIVSPSLWWDDESLLKLTPKPYTDKKNIFIAVGEEGPSMKRVANELYKKLALLKPDNSRLYFKFFPDQDHGDALHLAVYNAFETIFKKKTVENN